MIRNSRESGQTGYERKLTALATVGSAGDPAAAEAPLRKALADFRAGGYYVSKAAGLVERFGLRSLAPDLVAAFDHFAGVNGAADCVKTDPQCWAKNAIVSALHSLEYRPAAVYLRGLRHVQLEPVRGGRADSAGALRGKCALALVDSDLPPQQTLVALTDLLVDPEPAARLDAVRAIARLTQPESAILIRFKALTGDANPDVVRECLLLLMTLAPRDSIELVASVRFLRNPENELLCADAAEALASARQPEALAAILASLAEGRFPMPIRRSVLLTLAGSPLLEAAEYLLTVIASEPVEAAEAAVTSLSASRFHGEYRERVAALVERRRSPELAAAFSQGFLSDRD